MSEMPHTLVVIEQDSTDSPLLLRIKETTSDAASDRVVFNVEVFYSDTIFAGQPTVLDLRQLKASSGADNQYGKLLGAALLGSPSVPDALKRLGRRAVPVRLQLDQPEGRLGSLTGSGSNFPDGSMVL